MTTFQPDGPRADAAVYDVSRDHVTDWLTRTGDPAAETPAAEQVPSHPHPDAQMAADGWVIVDFAEIEYATADEASL